MTNREWLNSLSDLKFAAWIRNEFSFTNSEYRTHFCPNCGADMRGEINE